MKVIIWLLSIFIGFVNYWTTNSNFAWTKELERINNHFFTINKEDTSKFIIDNLNFINGLNNKFDKQAFKDFWEKNYLNNKNIFIKITGNDILVNYNKIITLQEEKRKELRKEIKREILKEVFKIRPDLLDRELRNYYLDVNIKGDLLISDKTWKRNTNRNFEDILDKIVSPYNEYNSLLKISDDIYINAYINYLLNKWESNKIQFSLKDIENSRLFSSVDEVKDMLIINSYRIRDWFKWDPAYRKFNINQIYNTFNSLLVLAPNKTMSYNEIYKRNDNGNKFKYWEAIVGQKTKAVYGWWTCGGSTWIYQGALWNANLTLKTKNHSWWYTNLYKANIDWKLITTPWLDSTYYTDSLDLKITNNWKFPVVIIAQTTGNIEKNFTLSFKEDYKKAEIKFIKKTKNNCYYWKRWNENITSCYKKIDK